MSKDSQDSGIQVQVCTQELFDTQIDGLSSMLHACVNEGSSINFLLPFTIEEARPWWIGQRKSIEDGSSVLLLALADSLEIGNKEVAGCVMMGLPPQPNQPHRAEVRKMLVHPKYRRRSVQLSFPVRELYPDSERISMRNTCPDYTRLSQRHWSNVASRARTRSKQEG